MLSPDDEMDNMSPEALRMDLDDLICQGDQLRLEQRRELLKLRSQLAPLTQRHFNAKKGEGINISVYQEIMHESIQDGAPAPFVTKIQSQLCSSLHNQEVQLTQIKIAQRSNKKLIIYLSKEIELLKEESKIRENKLTGKIDEANNANKTMEDMFEKDARDQEEEIKSLQTKLGIDPNTPIARRGSGLRRRFAPRQRIKRLSGSLKNIMANVGSETPKILRESKIWKDLKDAEERDASEMSAIRKGGRRMMGRLGRPRLGASTSDKDDDHVKSSAHTDKERGSILNSVFGSSHRGEGFFKAMETFSSSDAPPQPPDGIDDLSWPDDNSWSSTSEAYQKLSEEVYDTRI
jgi:hypothetical protein